jgi:hypothetical protein
MVAQRPLPARWTRLPRLLGIAALAVALLLALSAPAELAAEGPWWIAWQATAAALMATFPISMLLLWRNADRVPIDVGSGQPRGSTGTRPRTRRREAPGSKALFVGMALQAASLLILAGTLLLLASRG